MGEANTDHRGPDDDGLMAGLAIESGIPYPTSELERGLQREPARVGGGTLTGLAIHKDPVTNKETPVLVTCQHVMAGKKLADRAGRRGLRYEYKDAQGTERMYHPHRATGNQVGATLDEVSLSKMGINKADIATCEIVTNTKVSYLMHDPNHSGTGDTHATRKIVSGTVDPSEAEERGATVVLLGAEAGEATAYINNSSKSETLDRRAFGGIIELIPTVSGPAIANTVFAQFRSGDSGAPALVEVQPGVYRMLGIVFAAIRGDSDNPDRTTKLYALPASAAESAASIKFGEPLPGAPLLNEQDTYSRYKYKTYKAMTDFGGQALDLVEAEDYGTLVRWLGPIIPETGAGGERRWWTATAVGGTANPKSVKFVVRGSPNIDKNFAAGRRWGFKVHIRPTGKTNWTHSFSGEAVLAPLAFTSGADDKPLVAGEFTVSVSAKTASVVREYFRAYRGEEFEVKIEGAPANRAPVARGKLESGIVEVNTVGVLDASDSTDPDEDDLKYQWTQLNPTGQTLVPISGSDKKAAVFTPKSVGTLRFRLRVTDTQLAYDETEVTVSVVPAGVHSLDTLQDGETAHKTGTWDSSVASVNRRGRYAQFYVFRLPRRGKVQLTLSSNYLIADSYMYLLEGAGKTGRVIEYNNDYGLGAAGHARITRTLDAGVYTIEATTLGVARTGNFNVYARLFDNDATLLDLSVLGSVVKLAPAFAAPSPSYTAAVKNAISSVRVVATANSSRARVTVNGSDVASGERSGAISLSVGANTINVVVTAEDGTQKTYSVAVTRLKPGVTPAPSQGTEDDDDDDDNGGDNGGDKRRQRRRQRRQRRFAAATTAATTAVTTAATTTTQAMVRGMGVPA